MKTRSEFIGDEVWRTITGILRSKRPAFIAVAYLGTGASDLLPLADHSIVVVDASPEAVQAGQTNPHELLRLYTQRRARIYSYKGLHAKVFVCGRRAVVGSANVSRNSARNLCEAAVVLRERATVSAARQFVRGLARANLELGPAALRKLTKVYNTKPNFKPSKAPTPQTSQMYVMPVGVGRTKDDERAAEGGRRRARARMSQPRRHRLEDITMDGVHHYPEGMKLLMVTEYPDKRVVISPPGHVVDSHGRHPTKKKHTTIYLEVENRKGIGLRIALRRIGADAEQRLLRPGRASKKFAENVLGLFER